MSADDIVQQVEAFRQHSQRVVQERLQKIAGLPCEIPPDLLDPDCGLPRFPWVWYQGHLVVLRPTDPGGLPNRFGGTMPASWQGLNKGCQPHLVLRISPETLGLPIPPGGPLDSGLKLYFPLRSSREPELLYRQERDGRLVAVQSPKSCRSDRTWPYPDYPDSLPERGLSVQGPVPVPFLALFPNGGGRTLSVQELPEDGDRFLIVVVTACEETLGVSLLGSDAEAAAAQLVFLVDPNTGAVWTYSQCT